MALWRCSIDETCSVIYKLCFISVTCELNTLAFKFLGKAKVLIYTLLTSFHDRLGVSSLSG